MTPSFDEMHIDATAVREHHGSLERWLAEQTGDAMRSRRAEAATIPANRANLAEVAA